MAGVRESFRAALEDAGYRRDHRAKNGAAGLEFRPRQEHPDLVFLDLKMPGLSGVETLQRLHAAMPAHAGLCRHRLLWRVHRARCASFRRGGIDFNLARKPLSATEIKTIAEGRIGGVDPLAIGTGESWSTAQLVQS